MATNKNHYDIIVLGAGIAGVFATAELAKQKNKKVLVIEFGRPAGKRRKQLEGWLGCFTTGNTRLYFEDNSYENLKLPQTQNQLIQEITNQIKDTLSEFGPVVNNKNKEPNNSIKQKLQNNNFLYKLHNYVQWKPEFVHSLSKILSEDLYTKKNIKFSFDNEIFKVYKKSNKFHIETELGNFTSDKILLCLGRSGWRLNYKLLKDFGVIKSNNFAYYGFNVEMPAFVMKEWNECHCSLQKDNLLVGPLSWRGTVIPEDHDDLVISAWRSNEDRWNKEYVSFSVIKKEKFEGKGFEQTERLAKLAYVLSDNRIGIHKVKEYLKNSETSSCFHLVPEFNWFDEEMNNLDKIFNKFIEKAKINLPDIYTANIPEINLKENYETNIDGLFLAGESAGVKGIINSAISGIIAAKGLRK